MLNIPTKILDASIQAISCAQNANSLVTFRVTIRSRSPDSSGP